MEPVETFYDSRGFKTLVFDDVMPQYAIDRWLEYRKQIKFYKTLQQAIPMSFRVRAVLQDERDKWFKLHDWIEPYLKHYNEKLSVKNFRRSFINFYQKGDFIKVHADINGDNFSDDDLYLVVLIFLTPDSYINDPSDCGFIINNTFNTRDFIIDNKFNRMVLMDARSLHEPMVPTDNLQRLTLYAGYTISPKANPVVDRRERTLDTVGNIPGTQYYVDKSDFQYVD